MDIWPLLVAAIQSGEEVVPMFRKPTIEDPFGKTNLASDKLGVACGH
jgi:hypothetical protein